MPKAARSSSVRPSTLSLIGFALFATGIFVNPLLIAASVGVLGAAVALCPGTRVPGYVAMVFAAVLLLFQVGYGIGKNMAHRDNTVRAAAGTDAP
jgi:hypothetical protein